jgi:hypothetical protein
MAVPRYPGIAAAVHIPFGRKITMTLSKKKLFLAANFLAVAFTLSATSAPAQDISVVNGGRTTVKLRMDFLATLFKSNVMVSANGPSQLSAGSITFPITSGAISPSTGVGEVSHSGGMTFTMGTMNVRLDSFVVDTLSGDPFVTALLEVNGAFVGRVRLFDFVLPIDLANPPVPNDGMFYFPSTSLTLDVEAAGALNRAFDSKVLFGGGTSIGDWHSLVLVPLTSPLQCCVPKL